MKLIQRTYYMPWDKHASTVSSRLHAITNDLHKSLRETKHISLFLNFSVHGGISM